MIRLFERKLFKINRNKNILTWSIDEDIRKTKTAEDALKFAIKMNFLNQDIDLKKLDYNIISRIVHLYLLEKA
jgi:hypothetical protein